MISLLVSLLSIAVQLFCDFSSMILEKNVIIAFINSLEVKMKGKKEFFAHS